MVKAVDKVDAMLTLSSAL